MQKRILIAVLLLLVMTLLVGCGGGTNGTTAPEATTNPSTTTTVAPHLQIPTVSVSEDGLASWNAVENAANYRYTINGGEPKSTTKTSVQLSDGESISVMAVSGSDAFQNSAYSTPVTYTAPNPEEKSSIAQVLAGEEEKIYWVEGVICAKSPISFLLTDEEGDFLYVYAQFDHPYQVGDKVKVIGQKVLYANIAELKNIRQHALISQNNAVSYPTPVEADLAIWQGQLQNFTQCAYVTFAAPLSVSGEYLNMSVEGLEGAMLSLVPNGQNFENGATYTVTGYLLYINGTNTKYITVLPTSIYLSDQPDTELCPVCGKPADGDAHRDLPCGHKACQEGTHHLCEACGDYACMGNHEDRACGHKYCEPGEHTPCAICQNYLCQGEHHTLDCGHAICEEGNHQHCPDCGGYLCRGNHDALPCGHKLCQSGDHTECPDCDGYLCDGSDHSHIPVIENCPHCGGDSTVGNHEICPICYLPYCDGNDHTHAVEYCPVCNGDLSIGDHGEMPCGHRACEPGEHYTCPNCQGYLCQGSHETLACGHTACQFGDHQPCTACNGYLCQGAHDPRPCGHLHCQGGLHYVCSTCGNYLCQGDHTEMPCGHRQCATGEHGECPSCEGYLCDGSAHDVIECGHRVCDSGPHGVCDNCGGFLCEGGHEFRECGHRACVGGDHSICTECYEYVCNGNDHTHTPIELCPTCGNALSEGDHERRECGHRACEAGDHDRLACGHFVCHGGDHGLCEYCHTSRCVGDHHELECHLHHACQGEYPDHSSLGCGHYACEPGDHERCEYCGSYFCQTQYEDHSQRPCGHGYCEPDEHDVCPVCQNYRCQGDHRQLDCGHLACESGNHSLCEKCQGYLCAEGHFEMDCGHCSFQSGDHTPCSICGVFLCDPAHRDPCTTDSSILRFLNGALDVEHTVEGYVAAIGLDTILLTDARGNYAHIYCYAEGLSIGQEIGVVGTKYMDFGMPVLASVTDAYRISDGIAYEHPQPQIADVAYLQSMTESFAEVEYIRFTGRLNSDWGGFEFIVEGLENATVLIVYENAMLDDLTHGATYVVTGYALHISEEENGYRLINMISTSVTSIAICDYCGEVIISEEDHGICYTCWNHLCVGDHSLLPCNHLACSYGDHSPCEACCGYLCLEQHYDLYCGHKACEEGNHQYCYECGGYYCDGLDHNHMQELKVYTNKIDASFKTDFDGFAEEYNQSRIFSAQVNGGMKLCFELVEGYESNYNFAGWYIAVDGVPTELIHDMPQFVYNAEFGYEMIAVFEEKQNENSTVAVSISTPDLTFTVDGAPYSMENHYQDTLQKNTYLPMIAPEEGVGVVFVGWFVFNGNIEDPAELADLDNYGDCLTSERGYAHRVGENIQIVALYATPRFTERCPACGEKNIIHPPCPECNIRTCRCICDKIVTYPQYETTYVATGDDVVEIGTWEIADGEILFYPEQEKPVEWKYEICIGEGNTFTATYYLREDATQEFAMSITWTGYFDEEGNFYTESYRHHELFEAMKESSEWYTWEDIRTEPAQYIFFADGTLCGPDGGRPVYVPAYIWAILMSH